LLLTDQPCGITVAPLSNKGSVKVVSTLITQSASWFLSYLLP